MSQKFSKSPEEWKERLDPESYRVTRQGGTERPFANRYYNCHTPGTYHCICCGAALFDSRSKYDSGSGWPSFFQPHDPENLATRVDESHGMVRTEVLCAQCDAHLGHLFPDGPEPTGQRYCINSAALQLEPDSERKEE